jgi:Domain of unknown function (DUF397)
MSVPDDVPSGLNWRKAGRSISNGACVEVAAAEASVLVRDSVNPSGVKIAYAPHAWQRFVDAAKTGSVDSTRLA